MTLPENAQRWVVRCADDDDSCQPCKDNDGRTYRNRQAAYRDYPGGRGYVKCLGKSNCRCTVVKRGKENTLNKAQLPVMIARAQAAAIAVSGRALAAAVASHGTRIGQNRTETLAAEGLRAEVAPVTGGALYLYDAIGGWDGIAAMDVVKALAGVSGPLDVHINSYGGVIFEGAAIYNALDNYGQVAGNSITVYVDGVAASAASFIAMAATPYDAEAGTGGIVMARNATMMIHDGSGLCWGTADDMRDTADLLDLLSDTIAETYAARTPDTPAAEWRDVMRGGDAWYNSSAAVAAGLADRIAGAAPAEPVTEDGGGAVTENAWNPGELLGLFGGTIPPSEKTEGLNKADSADQWRSALKGAFA